MVRVYSSGTVNEKWLKTSDLDGMWKGEGMKPRGVSLHFHKVLGIVPPV